MKTAEELNRKFEMHRLMLKNQVVIMVAMLALSKDNERVTNSLLAGIAETHLFLGIAEIYVSEEN